MSADTLEIQLLGKQYHVACPPDQREALEAAAALLDTRMNELAQRTNTRGERLAVMVALNLAHDLLAGNPVQVAVGGLDSAEITTRINSIEARIDAVLNA